mmetsp:Transcript_109308/g.341989  ORF Transcript_109308/g.341989 Transcript_109308/m.341989 type:complete len:245 (+) Transcript_109308:1103-1837(+)
MGFARLDFLVPGGCQDLQQARGFHAQRVPLAWLQRGRYTQHVQRPALHAVRALPELQGGHVRLRRRGPGVVPEAHELPRALRHLRQQGPLVPRAAPEARVLRRAPPQRAQRHALGAHARAALPAGRRPHLLPRGPDPGGGGGGAEVCLRRLRALRLRVHALPQHQAEEGARQRGALGPRRGAARAGPGRVRPRLEHQEGRRGLLRPQDRHQASGCHEAEVPVRHHPARLQQSPALQLAVPQGGR